MRLNLRAQLTLMYSGLVALTIVAFAIVTYLTVSSELYRNLDTSLSRATASLDAVIRTEQSQAKQPLMPARRRPAKPGLRDDFAFLRQQSLSEFVGPLPLLDSTSTEDPIWSAVYEHILLNSSTMNIQVASKDGPIVWRSTNLHSDSLPRFDWFEDQGAQVTDGRITTYYTLKGVRYRLVLYRSDVAEITAAYPAADVDATLRQLFSIMLYSIPASMLVSLLAGWFLAQRSLRPVDLITQSARQITASNLAQRLPMPQTEDELARLTETLNDMIARLETAFQRIRQFTSDASHELKTPLAILMGELEIALLRTDLTPEARATLRSCVEEVERLNHVIQGLLDLSRADSGQVDIERQPVRLSILVENVCDDVQILAHKKHIALTTDVQTGVVVVGDRVRLHQALLNVIENAVKYTPPHGSVLVSLARTDDTVTLVVADSGIGIPANDLPHIFDRFFRVDKARSQNIHGTGLGLSIVRWIVDAHAGHIDVVSSEGSGTTFTVTLHAAL